MLTTPCLSSFYTVMYRSPDRQEDRQSSESTMDVEVLHSKQFLGSGPTHLFRTRLLGRSLKTT